MRDLSKMSHEIVSDMISDWFIDESMRDKISEIIEKNLLYVREAAIRDCALFIRLNWGKHRLIELDIKEKMEKEILETLTATEERIKE